MHKTIREITGQTMGPSTIKGGNADNRKRKIYFKGGKNTSGNYSTTK